jgi:hypothetical protein
MQGLLCTWLLLLVWSTIGWLINGRRTSFTDYLGMIVIWAVATGIVTLTTTIIFIVPYVCLRNTDTLLRNPWLIYLEASMVSLLISLALTYRLKPYGETFLHFLGPYLILALIICLLGCAFYMRRLKIRSRNRLITG